MATSGTISTTVFNTREVIDSAYRGCRLPAAAVTGEMIHTAQQQLWLLLSALANQGAPLWCQTRYLLGLTQGAFSLSCPVGTVDVLNANIRDVTRLTGTYTATEGDADLAFDGDVDTMCDQSAAAGSITMELETATAITTVGILPGATGTWSIQLQYSDDGVSYTTFYTDTDLSVTDMEWVWFDIQGVQPHSYYRLLAVSPTVLDVRELVWANNPMAIPVSRINKDDYYNLPDRTFQGRPVQYWLSRQRDVPIMQLWPAPDSASVFRQIEILVHRHIMDVGTLRQEIEVPQRWYDAVVWQLAKKLSLITPEVKPEVIPIVREEAADTLRLAWAEERDDSPMKILPNISAYTR
jgi:hypothetical protein